MDEKLDLILNELKGLNQRVGSMENRFDGMEKRFDNMENRFDNMEKRFDGIENDVTIIKSQLDENTKLTKAILHRQEETDAKLDSLSLDVHKMHGDVTSTKEQIIDIQKEIEFTYQKTAKNEMELFKLKSGQM